MKPEFEFDPSKTFLEQTWDAVGSMYIYLPLDGEGKVMNYCHQDEYFRGMSDAEIEQALLDRCKWFAECNKRKD